MAKRMLRDWTSSPKVDALSQGAEVFFIRLIMKADDYGSFHANVKLLRSALFPLKEYTDKSVRLWLKECLAANVLYTYEANGKDYIRIIDFGQRMRNMVNRFPEPDEETKEHAALNGNVRQVAATNGTARPELEIEIELEKEIEIEGEKEKEKEKELENENPKFSALDALATELTPWPTFEDFWNTYDKKVDRSKCEKKWAKIKQGAREKIIEHLTEYVRSTPDVQYRKNPLTYLNSEAWNNDIIKSKDSHGNQRITKQGTSDRLDSYRD